MAIIDFLMSTYPGFTFHTARVFPLATAFLMARHRADLRSDGTSPHNPLLHAIMKAQDATLAFAKRHCTIIPGAPAPGAPPSPGMAAVLAFAGGIRS